MSGGNQWKFQNFTNQVVEYVIIKSMLIIDENLLRIDELIDDLVDEFVKFPEVDYYKKAKEAFEADKDLQEKLALLKENENYLPYRPELRQLQKEINLNEKVYALRLAENDLQLILSNLTEEITQAISKDIYVEKFSPLGGEGRHGRHHKKI